MAETETSKLAIELHKKHSKASLAMALAMILKHGSMLQTGEIMQGFLDEAPKIKLDHLKAMANEEFEW